METYYCFTNKEIMVIAMNNSFSDVFLTLSPKQISICIARYELVRIEVCLRKQLYRMISCDYREIILQ